MRRGLLVILAMVAIGCGSVESSGTAPADDGPQVPDLVDAGSSVAALTESSWQLVGGIPVAEGHPATLWFRSDSSGVTGILGFTPCNRFGSRVSLTDGTIAVRSIESTDVGCEGRLRSTEDALFTGLRDVQAFRIEDGRLTLTGPESELIFERVPAPPTDDLVERRWILQSLTSGGTVSDPIGEPAGLFFGADGVLTFGTGCETIHGEWSEAGPDIDRTAIHSRGTGLCPDGFPDGFPDQERMIMSTLSRFRAVIEGELLTVTRGPDSLTYRLDTDLEVRSPIVRIFVELPDDGRSSSEPVVMNAVFRFGGICTTADDGAPVLLAWPEGHIRVGPHSRTVIFNDPATGEEVILDDGAEVELTGSYEDPADLPPQPLCGYLIERAFLVTGVERLSPYVPFGTTTTVPGD